MTQRIAASEYRRQIVRQMAPLGAFPVNFVGDVATGSPTISNVAVFAGLAIGMKLAGAGIAAGAKITALDSAAGTVTMDLVGVSTLTGVIVSAVPTTQMSVHLFNAPASPGPEPVISDFSPATFDGYAPIDLSVFVGPYTDVNTEAEVDAEQATWILTSDPVTPNNIYGYWIQYADAGSSGPGQIMLWEPFTNPLPMAAAGNAIVLVVPFTMPDPGTINVIP